jgi:hypothetical protein
MTELGIELHLSERPDGLRMLVVNVHGTLLDQWTGSEADLPAIDELRDRIFTAMYAILGSSNDADSPG